MEYETGMRVLEQHASVVIKGAMQHAAELLLSNGLAANIDIFYRQHFFE